ncbi:hypothetical protein B9Z55_021488 [Caenorhabditis nigoni]|uniref:SCP domain-containing protein n=1 Tax=Caenorhabditis nigoni TaxID=1611254 RepID=A0A2G5TS55_9PELO|nr:hypothetical protein B9Z55_021488 [Caenorhabditis nigoni]
MKTLFILWIFWTFSIESSEVSLDPDQKIFIEKLNNLRTKYIKLTSEMHELEWSPNLQNVLTNLELDRIPEESERNWRFTMISGYQNGIEELRNSTKKEVKTSQSKTIWYKPFFEHIMPYQKSVACAKKEKLLGNFKILCLFGPESVYREVKTGAPGSNCSDGYQNDNGMCRRAGKNTQTGTDVTTIYPTTQEQEIKVSNQVQFIQQLNEKRREFAQQWNISNMHELVELPESHINAENWTNFTMVSGDYGKELGKLEQKIHENKLVEHGLLDPMKVGIMCGGYEKDPQLYCILGPGNTTTNYTIGSPGSNCFTRFENNDGLCSLASTKTIIRTTPPGRIPENSIETRTLPKELADYVEVDGDDYDEDFPTGEPILDSGYLDFLQFWITVVFVLVFVF